MFNNLVKTPRQKHIPIIQTEHYIELMNTTSQMHDNLERLRNLLKQNEMIVVVHNENMSFHNWFNKDFVKLIRNNQEKVLVLAEGDDDKFPF